MAELKAWELSKEEAINYMKFALQFTSKNYRRKVLRRYNKNYKGAGRWVILGSRGVIRECENETPL